MNEGPLVSIIVTPYNQEKYIGKALDSLLSQNCRFSYEILVGEDCSTDNTRKICIEYADKYPDKIRLFLNEHNKGLINNYFDLIDNARGKYLADCGGDDYWISNEKLKIQTEILEKYPEVSMVYGNWQMLRQKTGIIETNKSGMSEDWYAPELNGLELLTNYIDNVENIPRVVLSTACYRKEWLAEVIEKSRMLFRAKNVVCEDVPIIFSMMLKGPIYYLKDEMMVYRVLDKSISHSPDKMDYLRGFAYDVFIQTIEISKYYGIKPKDIKNYVRNNLKNFVYGAFISKDKKWMNSIKNDMKHFGIRFSLKEKTMYMLAMSSRVNQWALYLSGKGSC